MQCWTDMVRSDILVLLLIWGASDFSLSLLGIRLAVGVSQMPCICLRSFPLFQFSWFAQGITSFYLKKSFNVDLFSYQRKFQLHHLWKRALLDLQAAQISIHISWCPLWTFFLASSPDIELLWQQVTSFSLYSTLLHVSLIPLMLYTCWPP